MSSLRKDRQLVRNAAALLILERDRLEQQTTWLRKGFNRYRPLILVGVGFGAGFVLGRKQFLQATRSILSIASLGLGLMRSSLGSMLVAATLGKTHRNKRKPAPSKDMVQG